MQKGILFNSSRPYENSVLPALCVTRFCWDLLALLPLKVFTKSVKGHCSDSKEIQPSFLIGIHLSQVWLLEMNANPALHTNCKVLRDIIPAVVYESLGK